MIRTPPPPRAALFDLDGTLVDSARSIAAAVNRLLAELGRPDLPVPAVTRMVGEGAAKLLERAFAAGAGPVPAEAFPAHLARLEALLEAAPPGPADLFPGAVEALERLAATGWRLGLCTNKPEAATRSALRALGLDGRFGAVLGGDSLPRRKPDPDMLLAALDRLAVPAGRAAMIGDAPPDAQAARAAGLPVVLVGFGYSREPLPSLAPAAVIDRFADLPEVLERLVR